MVGIYSDGQHDRPLLHKRFTFTNPPERSVTFTNKAEQIMRSSVANPPEKNSRNGNLCRNSSFPRVSSDFEWGQFIEGTNVWLIQIILMPYKDFSIFYCAYKWYTVQKLSGSFASDRLVTLEISQMKFHVSNVLLLNHRTFVEIC